MRCPRNDILAKLFVSRKLLVSGESNAAQYAMTESLSCWIVLSYFPLLCVLHVSLSSMFMKPYFELMCVQ